VLKKKKKPKLANVTLQKEENDEVKVKTKQSLGLLTHLRPFFPDSLVGFLGDEDFTFVGVAMWRSSWTIMA
jgi:hypothetical protein